MFMIEMLDIDEYNGVEYQFDYLFLVILINGCFKVSYCKFVFDNVIGNDVVFVMIYKW